MYLSGVVVEQRTLQKEVTLEGIGVHSGEEVRLTLKPSDSGRIMFRRMDLGARETWIDPRASEARNSTAILAQGFRIQTVEHLLASLFAFGVGSVDIELDGGEIPIMDGSARLFVLAIRKACPIGIGQMEPSARIVRPVEVRQKDALVRLEPGAGFRISYGIDFSHPAIGRQELDLSLTPEVFASEIAPARTFGFLRDAEELRKRGLALGSSLDNAIVLDDEKVVNPPLRFPDEFVRHKILDVIGDFALWGHPIIGRIRAEKAGHRLHSKALQVLLDKPDAWVLD